ncbi:MAG TPA: AGE family epimerase/isomerase [Phycisphaerae bacterium]|nr:AGE family epimerase/isomerase [Phycisphaerae bacterium]
MPEKLEIADVLSRTRTYLTDALLPFWLERSPDPQYGGFLTYFDRHGRPTGETVKTFLMQIRMLYTMASAHRAGYGGGRCAELAEMGASFLLDHYWDDAHGGWVWIADRAGRTLNAAKIGYGQCFAIYAFSEYFLATGDPRGRAAAERTHDAVMTRMADHARGGWFEIMKPDWTPEEPGRRGGDRKSMDVHMHMMEALTTFYEMTGDLDHLASLVDVIDLIETRMLHPDHGTGYIQFSLDFHPLPAILFEVEWGRDAEPADGQARPLDCTSYGHNVEFAWLLLHAADVMGQDRREFAGVVRPIFDHCVRHGLDREFGGVFVEGPHDGPATVTEKQFWQQAEVLVGLLDAAALFGDEAYWDAFRNVYDFVFARFVRMEAGGEWFERLDRRGRPIDDALGHAWKISYHTVRSMIQTVKRLEMLVEEKD